MYISCYKPYGIRIFNIFDFTPTNKPTNTLIIRNLRRKQGRKSKKNNRFTYVGTGKNITNRIDIDLRNELANKRLEFGHFEADSVESCRISGRKKSCLTVLVDRATRMTIIRKTASKTALQTTTSIIEALKPLSNNIISITYDNGCEFSQHEKINKELNIKSYSHVHIVVMIREP